MIYDEQVDRFLSSVPINNPNGTFFYFYYYFIYYYFVKKQRIHNSNVCLLAKTKTQKLLLLLKHKEEVIRDNALMCFTSALCQGISLLIMNDKDRTII